MLAAVKGYYDGNQIVIDEDVDLSIHILKEIIVIGMFINVWRTMKYL